MSATENKRDLGQQVREVLWLTMLIGCIVVLLGVLCMYAHGTWMDGGH